MNLIDFDYRSREISLWPWMDMKWWAGGHFSNLYFDSNQGTDASLAAAGTGVTDRHVTSRFVGFGPHAGGELACFLDDRHWSILGRFEVAGMLGRIHQSFSETTSTPGANGLPVAGYAPYSSSQDVPTINVQVGLRWQPSPQTELFIGYQYEYFWNAGRLSNIGTMGEVYDHAIVIRASCDF